MSIPIKTLKEKLYQAFPECLKPESDSNLEVWDLTGTEDHYKARIVSSKFDDLSRIERHRLVHETLSEELKGPIHALTLELLSPAEAIS